MSVPKKHGEVLWCEWEPDFVWDLVGDTSSLHINSQDKVLDSRYVLWCSMTHSGLKIKGQSFKEQDASWWVTLKISVTHCKSSSCTEAFSSLGFMSRALN